MDPSVPRMKGKLKHVKKHRQGEFISARTEDSLWERREPQVGKQRKEAKGGKRSLPPCFEESLRVRGLFWEQLQRENVEWSKGRRFLKSFTVHTCALQLQRQ